MTVADSGNSGGAPAADAAASNAVAATPDAGAPAAATAEAATKPDAAAAAVPLVEENLMADAKAKDEPAAAEGEKKEGEEEKPAADEPIDYSKLEVPDTIAADDPAVAKFKEAVAELKLPVETSQALISQVGPEITKMLQQPYEAYKTLQTQWRNEVNADPEIGGANQEGVMATIGAAINRFGRDPEATDPAAAGKLASEFRAAMRLTGAGQHPAVIKMFNRLASQLVEGKAVVGTVPKPIKNPANALYPSHNKAEG